MKYEVGTVFVIALVVYLVTLAPGITWAHYGGDGGDLITASMTFGVPHPPGYPTYSLVSRLFSWVTPFGTIAWRYNFFSAVCMAGASAFIPLIIRSKQHVAGIAAGLTFAFAPLVWSQAIITEVYALNMLVLAGLLWALFDGKRPILAGFLFGLSLTTHLTSALMLPLVIWACKDMVRHVPTRRIVMFCAAVLLGLSPLFTLFLLARSGSPVNWFDPSTVSNWWVLVSGQIYRANLFNHPIMPRLQQAILPTLRQFSYVGWVLLFIGWGRLTKPCEGFRTFARFSIILPIIFYAAYVLGYDAPDAAVFALPALLLIVLLMADGIERLGPYAIILPMLAFALNLQSVNLHDDLRAQNSLQQIADQIPADAILMASGDHTIFTLWYYHHVEGFRPDTIPIDSNLFQFEWYRAELAKRYRDLTGLAEDDLIRFEAENGANRPFCTLSIPTETIACTKP